MTNRGLWLGFVFFVALVLLGFGTLIVTNVKFPWSSYPELTVHFERVQGLRAGDSVRVDGVILGKVDTIELRREGGVMVKLSLDEPIVLYRDSEIMVESSSVLGGSFISIRRGSAGPPLDDRQPLVGRNRPGLEEFSELASENRENLRHLIANLKDVTQSLKDGQGTVGKLLKSDELHRETVDTIKSAREAIADVRTEVKRLGETLNQNITKLTDKIGEKLDKAEGPVGALLNDKKMTEQLNRTLTNVEDTAKNLKDLTDAVKKGEGALGKIVTDKEMGEKLKTTIDNIERSSSSIRTITGRLEGGEGAVGKLLQEDELYEQARRTLDDLDRTLGRAARAVVEVVGDSRLYDDSEVQISKLGIRITPSDDKYFQVGAAFLSLNKEGEILFKNLVEDNKNDTIIKPDIQVAYRVPWFLGRRLTLRAGLLEGKPGGGADLHWEDWLLFTYPVQMTFEIRDAYNSVDNEDIDEGLDGPLLRFYAKFPLWIRKENWLETLLSTVRVYAGVSRVGEDPEAMIGIGLEWPDDDIRTLVSLIGVAR